MSKYATVDPATGSVVREFDTMAEAEVEVYLEAAHAAYLKWRHAELAERSAVLQRIADAHRERSEELARLMTTEMGKPVAQAKGEVALAASIYEYYATKGPEFLEEERLDIAGKGSAVVRTEPIGALVGIMPELPLLPGGPASWHRTSCSETRSCSSTRATARSRHS